MEIKFDSVNARKHGNRNKETIKSSLETCGAGRSIVMDSENVIIGGNGVFEQAQALGLKVKVIESDGSELIAVKRTDLKTGDDKRKLLALADNRTAELAEWDDEQLQKLIAELPEIDLSGIGFDEDFLKEINTNFSQEETKEEAHIKLSERFGVPPFSVLNAREGWWQNRKAAWIAIGIQSELGRGDNLIPNGGGMNTQNKYNATPGGRQMKSNKKDLATSYSTQGALNLIQSGRAKTYGTEGNASEQTGTSIFDPVLTELCYRWFSPAGGLIIDPFSGGSVRGIVASKLGRKYIGVDLRHEQIEANKLQGQLICKEPFPIWHTGDSLNINEICKGKEADFIFSCPPYVDLEVYSDNPADISNMDYADFKKIYFEIIKKTFSLLNQDRFACFVVGECRDKKGNYYNFVGDTVQAFIDAGYKYYNEAILITCVGSLPIRAGRVFASARKLGKTHQNVLIFVKGDAKKATENIGEVEFGEMESENISNDSDILNGAQ